jgi:multidrug resistance efflux pump
MSWNVRILLAGLVGLGLLAATTGGAVWVLHSRADDGTVQSKEENHTPARVDGAVCLGHVDVEGGVASLYPTQIGRVSKVLVHEDETVKSGQVLLQLDDRPARFLEQQAEADLRAAEANLAQANKGPELHALKVAQQQQAIAIAQNKLSQAQLDFKHARNLFKSQNLNIESMQIAEVRVKEAEAAIKAQEKKLDELGLDDPKTNITRAESDVAAKKAQLEQARFALEECSLRAPFDGKVLRIFVSAGDTLGSQPKQPAIQFCPAAPRIIRAEVEQEFADRVVMGQVAEIQDDTNAGPTWHGKVARISDWYTHRRSILLEPLQFNDVRTLECIIRLDRNDTPLRIGQRVRVHLTAAK